MGLKPLAMAPSGQDLRAFILARLPLRPVPGIPEICLHKAGLGSGLWRLAERDDAGFGPPYWAYYWAGGLALARHVLDRPETVAGRRVLDLGAGSGLVGIAAALSGARSVTAADVDPYAVAAAALNAEANGVTLSIVAQDLMAGPVPDVELILVGDLFYDEAIAARATTFLDRCRSAGVGVLIGDPGRAFLPHARLRLVADYPVEEAGRPGPGHVYAFD